MKPGVIVFGICYALGVLVTPGDTLAKARPGFTKGVANSALVAAAKAAPLKLIDYGEERCRNDRTVETWLKELTGPELRAIAWSGGPCQMVNDMNPLDSGSDWCAQAEVRLKHPRGPWDRPTVEIFFETPRHGRPGVAYAFRATAPEAKGDRELIRFRRDFENAWVARFPAARKAVRCPGDDADE